MADGMNIDDKIKLAINLCNRDRTNFYQFNYLYPFTTENIGGYIDKFDLNGKNLLTVGSSGDQALNAILRDCKTITVYDVCPFTKEYFNLKKALILCLTRESFLKFLCYQNYPMWLLKNRNVLNLKTFDYVYGCLANIDLESSYFWSELLTRFRGIEIRRNLFNVADERNPKVIQLMNRYLVSDAAFNALRDRIDEAMVEFINGDILNINLDKKFDNIFLSNIAAYLNPNVFKEAFIACADLLKDDGQMLVSYLYDTDYDEGLLDSQNDLYNIRKMRTLLSSEIGYEYFIGNNGLAVNDQRMTDGILTYKKVKKI